MGMDISTIIMRKLGTEYFFIVIFISLYISEVTSDVCYSCRDSSSKEGKVDCQFNTGRMEDLHKKLMEDAGNNTGVFLKSYGRDPYVQDCSVFPNHSYCCIEEFEGGGSIKSYIRTCCDGSTWSFDPEKVQKLKLVTTNNDSLCAHDTTSLTTICVRMCKGNFCNGPTAKANIFYLSPIIILLIKCLWIYYYLS